MDLIYKIYSVYLYDNQLNHDYFVLYNRRMSFTGELNSDLPYALSGLFEVGALNKILNLDKKCANTNSTSVDIMKVAAKSEKVPFIYVKDFLIINKIKDTVDPRYSIYEIFWNETKSGINIHDYELAAVWNPGQSSCSIYRVFEEKENRTIAIRNNKFSKVNV